MKRGYLIVSLIIFAIGCRVIFTQQAKFNLGGNDFSDSASIPIDLEGLDAVALGVAVIGGGVINLAVGLKGTARRRVFWIGAAMLGAAVLYALVLGVFDVSGFVKRLLT